MPLGRMARRLAEIVASNMQHCSIISMPAGGGDAMTAPRVKLDIDASAKSSRALGLGHAVEALEGLLTEAVRAEMPLMSSSIGCWTGAIRPEGARISDAEDLEDLERQTLETSTSLPAGDRAIAHRDARHRRLDRRRRGDPDARAAWVGRDICSSDSGPRSRWLLGRVLPFDESLRVQDPATRRRALKKPQVHVPLAAPGRRNGLRPQ